MSNQVQEKKSRIAGSVICRILGVLFIVAVIITAVPLTVPRLMGYEIYNVETGSMNPEIPAGSVILVQPIEPNLVQVGDVITFRMESSTVTHRVTENRVVEGEFKTKGDANETEDLSPVSYSDLIGVVKHHYPVVGKFLAVYSSTLGKIYVLAFAACGVLLNILGGLIRKKPE